MSSGDLVRDGGVMASSFDLAGRCSFS